MSSLSNSFLFFIPTSLKSDTFHFKHSIAGGARDGSSTIDANIGYNGIGDPNEPISGADLLSRINTFLAFGIQTSDSTNSPQVLTILICSRFYDSSCEFSSSSAKVYLTIVDQLTTVSPSDGGGGGGTGTNSTTAAPTPAGILGIFNIAQGNVLVYGVIGGLIETLKFFFYPIPFKENTFKSYFIFYIYN